MDTPKIKDISNLPGPFRLPLVGNLLQIRPERIHQNLERWAQKYGPVYRVFFGPRPVLVIANHQDIAGVLRERPQVFRRPKITAALSAEMGGEVGLFMAEGVQWRHQRRMVMAGFAPGPIRAYLPTLKKVARRLQTRWGAAAQSGQAIDLSDDLKRYTVDIIAGLAFGTEVNTLESGEDVIQKHLDQILPAIARRSLSLFPYWRYFKLPRDRRLDESLSVVRTEITRLISEAKQGLLREPDRQKHPQNLLEAMLVAAAIEGSGVSESEVIGNVSTMLLAGEDTTANSIAWLIDLLYRNPNALAKLHAEVTSCVAAVEDWEQLDLAQLDGLVYLDACIQESMRIKPVGPFMPLEATQDTVVGDVRVPQHTLVICTFRHETLMDTNFAQPQLFKPERWLAADDTAGNADAINKKVSMPFGSGLRTCPGRYLALLEIKIALVMLLNQFEIAAVETPNGREPEELMAFTMSPIGMRLRLRNLPRAQPQPAA